MTLRKIASYRKLRVQAELIGRKALTCSGLEDLVNGFRGLRLRVIGVRVWGFCVRFSNWASSDWRL